MDTQATWVTNGNMWQHPHAVKNALCFDGRRRTVRLNVQPDSYFSWSGRTTILGKSVRGYVATDTPGDAEFRLFDSEWVKIMGHIMQKTYKGKRAAHYINRVKLAMSEMNGAVGDY